MCGRFTLTCDDIDVLARELAAEVDPGSAASYRPRWNIAPTDTHWVVRVEGGARRLVQARFGLSTPGGKLVINARSETAAELRTFRDAFQRHRCLVPADGFFEWQGARGERRPLWLHAPAGALLVFAGLMLEGRDGPAFVILTTPANDLIRPFHDRMPALLSRDAAAAWLARPDPTLLCPAQEGTLVAREVSTLVNDVGNDAAQLLEHPAAPRQLRLV